MIPGLDQHTPTRFYGGIHPLQAGAVATAEESQAALEFEAPDSSRGSTPSKAFNEWNFENIC